MIARSSPERSPNSFVLRCEVLRHRSSTSSTRRTKRGDALVTTVNTGEQEKPASAIPGRVVELPADATHLVFGMFGVQSRQSDTNGAFIDTLRAHFRRRHSPISIERAQYIDPQGYSCDLLLAYWLDREVYRAWSSQPEVAAWWAELPCNRTSEVGYWREVLSTPKDRFQFGGGGKQRAASAQFLPLVPSRQFGCWGGYRDRLATSEFDTFDSPYSTLPALRLQETKGKRLSVEAPENVCFLREGQGWSACVKEERAILAEKIDSVVDQWIAFLRDNPTQTGCFSLRDCREQDTESGALLENRSQFAFLLSLGHIEHAARTQPTHLAVHDTIIRMYKEATFTPKLHLWVEVHVLPAGAVETEYINCHPQTDCLPYFDAHTVSQSRRLG